MEQSKVLEKLLGLYKIAKNKHQLWESEWEEVARYALPKSGGFYDANTLNMPKDTSHIYDPTPRIATRRSSAALYAYSANPVTKWFHYAVPILKTSKTAYKDIIGNSDIKAYLEDIADTHRSYLNSALITSERYAFDEMIAFGVSGIFLQEVEGSEILSSFNLNLKDMYALNDGNGRATTVFRKIMLNPVQAVDKFGRDKVAKEVLDSLEIMTNIDKESEYIHCVYKRSTYDIIPDLPGQLNMPWASVYIDTSNKHLISEGGYEEQPFGIGRLGPVGQEVYCNSPGIDALPAMRSLNKLASQQLEAGDSAFNPAYNVPIGVYRGALNLNPNAINYYNPDLAAGGALASPINKVSGYQVGKDVLADQREMVKQSMYDLVVESSSDSNTTYGQQQDQIRQLILMSPWNASLEADFFKPLIKRSFGILYRRGAIPAPPPALAEYLDGKPLEIVLDNPLSRAANFPQLQAMDRLLQVSGNLAQLGAMDKIDIDETIDMYREFSGAPLRMVRTNAAAKKLRDDRAKQQQEAMKAQQEMEQANAAPKLADAYKKFKEAEGTNGQQQQ